MRIIWQNRKPPWTAPVIISLGALLEQFIGGQVSADDALTGSQGLIDAATDECEHPMSHRQYLLLVETAAAHFCDAVLSVLDAEAEELDGEEHTLVMNFFLPGCVMGADFDSAWSPTHTRSEGMWRTKTEASFPCRKGHYPTQEELAFRYRTSKAQILTVERRAIKVLRLKLQSQLGVREIPAILAAL